MLNSYMWIAVAMLNTEDMSPHHCKKFYWIALSRDLKIVIYHKNNKNQKKTKKQKTMTFFTELEKAVLNFIWAMRGGTRL